MSEAASVRPPPVLVLDLDGTLVDTADDLVATLNVVLGRRGFDPQPYEAARLMVGFGARHMIKRALAAADRSVEEAELAAMTDDFFAHYGGRIAEASRPFPGALAALDRFAAAGWRLAICTNKQEALARRLLGELDLEGRFAAISGQDTFAFMKPDPRHLTETVRLAGGDPGQAIMVGDSATDIDTAHAAGVPVVAVSFGYSAPPVRELGPDRVIDHFDELWDAVAALMPATAA